MSKKSIITSIVLGAVITLSLGVYTLVAAIIALTTPHHNTVSLAYTSNQKITAFANYKENENLTITYGENQSAFLDYNADENYYSVKEDAYDPTAPAGTKLSFVAVATTDKHGSTTTYNVDIFKQGTGSEEDPYQVANASGLKDAAAAIADPEQTVDYVDLAANVDMAGTEWTAIGSRENPFAGNFNGKDHKVSNLTINVNKDNYLEHLTYSTAGAPHFELNLGLFGKTNGATITGVSVENASITVAEDLLDTFKADITTVVDGTPQTAKLGTIRVGFLVADATNTQIIGYVEQPVEEGEEEPAHANAKVSGTYRGIQVTNMFGTNFLDPAIGGAVGMFADGSSTTASKLEKYDIDVTINDVTNDVDNYGYTLSHIGGAVGRVVGNSASNVAISDVNATLTSNTVKFNRQIRMGGFAAYVTYANVNNVSATLNAEDYHLDNDDKYASDMAYNDWLRSTTYDARAITKVAGIAVTVENSQLTKVTANANIEVMATCAAGFGEVTNGTVLTDVTTKGNVVGYYASGLAVRVIDSSVTYNAVLPQEGEEAFDVVAADVTLDGYHTSGLVDTVIDSNIIGHGAVVKSVMNALGYKVTTLNINDTVKNAGLVGYFYINDSTENIVIDGFKVDTTINNGVNMSGLVAYLGNQTAVGTAKVVVSNNEVTARLNAYAGDAVYQGSSAHKVSGGVGVIFGNATLESNTINVLANAERQADGKYGFAMFGGLVARIAGTNVTLNNNKTAGSAYANSSIYTKAWTIEGETSDSFVQITAGGLVGSIASYGVTIAAGGLPVAAQEGRTVTVDNVANMDVSDIHVTANTANVEITIDYKVNAQMNQAGQLARSVGSLIGLVANSGNITDGYTTFDLTGNNAYGKVNADDTTYTYLNSAEQGQAISSQGYGLQSQKNKEKGIQYAVGSTFDLTVNASYDAGWNMIQITAAPSTEE